MFRLLAKRKAEAEARLSASAHKHGEASASEPAGPRDGLTITAGGQATTKPEDSSSAVKSTREESSGPDRLPALTWSEPVRHGDGSGFQLSTCGRWSVVAEREAGRLIFRLFSRTPIPTLRVSTKSAQEARNEAQRLTDASCR